MRILDVINSNKLKAFVVFIVAIVGFVAAWITIGTTASLIVVILSALAFYILFIVPSRAENKKVETENKKIEELRKEFQKIFGTKTKLELKTVEVLVELMAVKSDCINSMLNFSLLSYQGTIDEDGNYHGINRAKGYNIESDPCTGLKVVTGSGSWNDLELKTIDTQSGEELKPESFDNIKAEITSFEILFRHPIQQKESFDVTWSFDYRNACGTNEDDADVCLIWPYERISGRVEINLSLLFKPKSIQLYHVDKEYNVALHTADKPISSDYKDGKYSFSITIREPKHYLAFIPVYRI